MPVGNALTGPALKDVPSGPVDDDDGGVLAIIAIAANFAGWVIGLAIGGAVVRVSRAERGEKQ